MSNIRTVENEIEISENHWRLFDHYSLSPDFEVMRAGGVLRYTARYGEAHGLPGTRLSAQYVRAVVAGWDPKAGMWRLGLHVSESPGQKPAWVELTQWPTGNKKEAGVEAQRAGRALAEYLGTPLKLFGVKQPSGEHKTGPLVPHHRRDISAESVRSIARQIHLPVEFPGMWVGLGRTGIQLRLDKNIVSSKPGEIAPAYQNVELDTEKQLVKMLPPTGLLGTFFSTPGRQIAFGEIRNVEYRHMNVDVARVREDREDNLLTEIRDTHHTWELYLTMAGESLLIAQASHVTDGELESRRVTDVGGSKFDTNFDLGVEYYRQYEKDQQRMESAEHFVRSAAYLFAAGIGTKLVEIAVGTELA